MPLSSSASTFRSATYQQFGYLATPPETVVLTGAIIVAADADVPTKAIGFTTTGGTYLDVREGMLIRVYSATGTRKGTLRVATGGSIVAGAISVNEFSRNTVALDVGDVIKVMRRFEIFDKLVRAGNPFDKDSRIVFTDQTADPKPTTTGGGPVVMVTTVGGTGTHSFLDTNDRSNDRDNPTHLLTVAWDFIDATPSSASTQTVSNVVFPVGYRQVTKTVTDSVNGESSVKYIDVYCFDFSTYSPLEVAPQSIHWSMSSGGYYTASFELVGDASEDVLPRGGQVVYFEREYYNGTEGSYSEGDSTHANIKFTGFLTHESILVNADEDAVTFDAVGPLGILDLTPALSQLAVSKSTPTTWQEQKALSVWNFLYYLWYWGSTLGDVWDVVHIDATDLLFGRLAVENIDSVAGQLRDIASSMNVDLTCDRLGRILFVRDPDMDTEATRAAKTSSYAFTTDDFMELESGIDHRGSVKTVTCSGFVVNSTTTVFTISGRAPSPMGTGTDDLPRQIFSDTTDAKVRVGKRFAKVNGLYNGRKVARDQRATLPDMYDVFDPALRNYVNETLASTTNKRAYAIDVAERWLIDEYDVSYDADAGTKSIEAVLSHETDGESGTLDPRPQSYDNGIGDINLPDTDWPSIPYVPPGSDLPASNLYKGTQRIAAICDNGLALTGDPDLPVFGSGASTVYVYATWASLGVSGTVLLWVPDPNPAAAGYGWLVTSTDVYYGALATGIFTSKHTFADVTVLRSADASIGAINHFCVVSYIEGVGTKSCYTTDNSTFTENTISSVHAVPNSGISILPGCFYDFRDPLRIYTTAHTGSNASFNSLTSEGKVSSNGGVSFGTLSSPLFASSPGLAQCIHVPFDTVANPSAVIAFYGVIIDNLATATSARLYRANGASATDISPNVSSKTYAPRGRYSIQTAPQNIQRLLYIGQPADGNDYAVFRSDNAMAATPSYTILDPLGSVYRGGAIAGDNPDVFYLFGLLGSIGLVTDALTIVSQTGNLASFTPGAVLALAGY